MAKTRIVDLSLPMYNHMPSVMPELPPVIMYQIHTLEKEGNNILMLSTCTHNGTHVDAPHHIGVGKKLEEIPLEDLYGDGVILDMPRGELGTITASDLEKATPEVEERDIVILNTGWGKLWGKVSDADHKSKRPGITRDAAEWLVKKKVKVIGGDIIAIHHPSIREADPKVSVHYALLTNNIVILECLTNLEKVAGRRLKIGIFPLPIKEGDGSPVRAVAFLEE